MISTQPFQVKMSVKPGCLNNNINKKNFLRHKQVFETDRNTTYVFWQSGYFEKGALTVVPQSSSVTW